MKNFALVAILAISSAHASPERAAPKQAVVTPDGTIYLAMSNGLYESKDNARSWRAISAVGGFMMSVGSDASGSVLAGSNAAESLKAAGSGQWKNVSFEVDKYSQGGGETYITDSGGVLFSGRSMAVFRSTDGGKNWKRTSGLPTRLRGSMVQIPGALMVVAQDENAVYESRDKGATWEKSKGLGGLQDRVDSLYRDSTGALYVVSTMDQDNKKTFFRRDAGATNWQALHLQTPPHPGVVTMLDRTAYVFGSTTEMLLTTDFKRWTVCSTTQGGDYLDKVFSVIKMRTGLLMLSSFSGVFRSEDGGKTWIPTGKGLPAPMANLKNPTMPLLCK